MLANASNWMLHEKYVKLYNDSMFAKLDGKRNESTPYFENAELNSVHADTKNDSIVQVSTLFYLLNSNPSHLSFINSSKIWSNMVATNLLLLSKIY